MDMKFFYINLLLFEFFKNYNCHKSKKNLLIINF